MTKLTAKSVLKFVRRGEPREISDASSQGGVRGLRLIISSKTAASWELRWSRHGRERYMGLGSVKDYSLADARDRARAARQQIKAGHDPLDAKRAAKSAQVMADARMLTFEQAAYQYFEAHEHGWKNLKHRQQFISTLKMYVFPKIGGLAISAIDTPLVLQCVKPIWADKTETAARVRSRIEKVLGWATVNGYRTGDNPARWRDHLAAALPAPGAIAKVEHHAAMPFDEISAFMADLRQREAVAARALEFTILTAARTGESIGATWDEIDLKAKTWTVPANRIKGGKEHKVPLSDRALELLKTAFTEDGNQFVFIGPHSGGLSNMAMAALMKRMGRRETVHGFRSCFRDWAAELTNHQNNVVEMALAHVIGDKVEAAYRRGDLYNKRVKLMQDWAKYCTTDPAKVGSNVVPLKGRG